MMTHLQPPSERMRFPGKTGTVFVLLNDFPGALSLCDVCVLVRVLFWDRQVQPACEIQLRQELQWDASDDLKGLSIAEVDRF